MCPDGKQPNAAVTESCVESASVSDATDLAACAAVVLGVVSSQTDCEAVLTASTADAASTKACTYTAAVREQTACEDCPEFFAGRDGFCDQCPDGTRVLGQGTDLTDCEICPEGWVGTGSTCTKCPPTTLPDYPNMVEPPIWDGAAHVWIPVLPARTQCLSCPQYMYSPTGDECFWCSAGEIVNSDRTGCVECSAGQYGLVDDRVSGENFFSEALTPYTHPNVLTYGGHGTVCTSCVAGEQPQRGIVVDHTMTGETHC